mgnify:CR=1 FL=1
MIPVRSYQIADSIDIKQLKTGFKSELLHGDADELFYRIDAGTLTYIFKYGVVCFLNASAECVDRILLAQCQVEGMRLVTTDRALQRHPLVWRPA